MIDTGLDYLLRHDGQYAFGAGCGNGPGSPGCSVVASFDLVEDDGQRDNPSQPHGTHVSGIVHSVAPAAGIVAIDVQRPDGTTRLSDVVRALQWAGDNWRSYRIKVANVSLGSGRYTSLCDEQFFALSDAVRGLRRRGVIVVAASGNVWSDALNVPGCARLVVRVGAVYDADVGPVHWRVCTDPSTAPDQITCFSNSAPFLTILAPGAVINFANLITSGTSQSAPHVAGAIGSLRGENGFDEATSCTFARIVKTGRRLVDPRNGLTFPRVDLAAAASTYPNSVGDCDASSDVTEAEVTLGLAIALGQQALSACPPFDANADNGVTIDELVAAVNLALYGCAVGAVHWV